ncbi:GGDEF domain-containing protein [Paractinoplanes brasiliensis]|uniref:GGDEF domain-containing protein n=1 Tax=Paractinoplanes brasiliensis TaxID=52695 RepID=UPI00105E5809|nr:GGDEF domain-containing protein [Actinoplanes brasiliensis]
MAFSGIRKLWIGYGAVAAALTVARILVPEGSTAAALVTYGYPLLTVAAIAVGVRVNRPPRTLPWILLLIMTVAGGAGNVAISVYLYSGGVPFPSAADIFFLACYPLLLAGLMLLVDGLSWRRDRAGVLDTLMVAGALGLGVWMLFLRPLVGPAMPLGDRLITMAYPLADLLLLAGVIRMFTAASRRGPAFWQLVASLAVQGLAHVGWVWQSWHGTNDNELAPAFVLSALLLGGAALHPSMATVGGADHRPPEGITPARVLLISSACLLSPVLLIADGLIRGDTADWLAASVCSIAVFLLLIVRILGLVRTVQNQATQLESLAYLDALTGIPNRRAWDAELDRRLAAAQRSGGTLVVGLIDLDHFKRYNDRLGHPAGDELLRTASSAWQEQLRAGDLIARYGGEEFGLIMHCRLKDAAVILERLMESTPDGQTFSAGLAQWAGEESPEQLTARADGALYTAKRGGRNQFSVAGHPAYTDQHTDFLTDASPIGR